MLAIVGDSARGQEKMDVDIALIAVACTMQGPFNANPMHAPQIVGVLLRDGNLLGQGQRVGHGDNDLAGDDGILAPLPAIHQGPVAQVRASVPPRQHVVGARGVLPAPVKVGGLICRAAAAASLADDTLTPTSPADDGEAAVRRRHNGIP